MEDWKENQLGLVVSGSTASFQDLLESQKELFHCQIVQLQNIVTTQCKLTGVNPLSQEMAAGALSIKIGKRPRDLLNPKAIKYMQSVFSIKDAISKRESREISALFGVTVTQVREFFSTQRSRVRKFVRLSREKAIESNACKEVKDGISSSSDPSIPIDPVPLQCVGPTTTEGPTCSISDDSLSGIDDSDKHFVENIFDMMRKEETFSGQVNLMEWILQIQTSSVLCWFLTKGGVMILATWLSQAAVEEQTSVLRVILKVLFHLPLHKAVPVQMSAILQSVNRLRFYRTSDISNRARILLSRWSKIFAKSQAMKKPNALKSSSDADDEMLLKQSIGEVMGNELWESKADITVETLNPLYESSENFRKLETSQPMKLLTASTDDSDKKLVRGVSSGQTKERRTVLLVEQPGQKVAGRSPQVTRSVPPIQGRPLSADDIQKAKMRAQFMQIKYGKTSISSDESLQIKTEGPNKCSFSQASIMPLQSKAHARLNTLDQKKLGKLPSNISNQLDSPLDSKMTLDPEEPSWKKCKRVQIPWKTPPEMMINGGWSVGSGENSKEVEVQTNRIHREMETTYNTVQEIPLDPKEPWDLEMDYDDTLTPEILTEQLPDADGVETMTSPHQSELLAVASAPSSSSQNGTRNGNMLEPDLELLAVLLKNPELVFALTSGQGGGLSNEETVKLLDMIKANGVSSLGNLTGLDRKAEEKVEVCLPSPTPSSDPVTSGWRPESAKNPFSRQSTTTNRGLYDIAAVGTVTSSQENHPSVSLMQPQLPLTSILVPPRSATLPEVAQQSVLQEKQPAPLVPFSHQSFPTNSSNIQIPTSEVVIKRNNPSICSLPLPNMLAAASPSMQVENYKPTLLPGVLNTAVLPTQRQQTQLQSQPRFIPEPQLQAHSWNTRQGQGSSRNSISQANLNNYNALVEGPVQASLQPGPPWDRNEFVDEPKFESWSPQNTPNRLPQHMPAWNYSESRMNYGNDYRRERSRSGNPSGYRVDHGRNGSRRWRERGR